MLFCGLDHLGRVCFPLGTVAQGGRVMCHLSPGAVLIHSHSNKKTCVAFLAHGCFGGEGWPCCLCGYAALVSLVVYSLVALGFLLHWQTGF